VKAATKPLDIPAVTLCLLTAMIWGGNAVAAKLGLLDAPPFRLTWMRFLVGGLTILGWALWSKASLRFHRDERWAAFSIGVLFSVQIGMFLWGTNLTTAGHAVVLVNVYPVHVMLLAHFFGPGDRMTVRKLAAVSLAYTGVILVFLPRLGTGGASLAGDAVISAAGALIGVRTIALNRALQRIPPIKLLCAQGMVGTVMFWGADLLLERHIPFHVTGRLGLSVAYQGILISGLNFGINLWLLKQYRPTAISTFYLSTPLFGVLLGWLILGEPLTGSLLAGATLVVLGIGLATVPEKSSRRNPREESP
jgi:drug/metabolite transporter (DMT)-like permease